MTPEKSTDSSTRPVVGKRHRKCMQQTEKVMRSSSKQKTLLTEPVESEWVDGAGKL